ncbi:MAG: YceI family protein [Parvibaculum sp.]|uniref:YceI family protein n=1 Tax=Parvibaculum sp. TaxID=2024848 RepID=UPI0025FDE12D|nr:YceI family protein [Parvibaculum sp.]MCE9648662.1 YceI family protein [Parvibaculum sp.]
MIRFLAFAAAMAAASPALAVTQWTVAPDPEAISWEATQGGAPLKGHCAKFDAGIAFDPAALAASSVKVSIDTGACQTGDAQKDEYLPQEVWFNVAAFPQAVFEAKSFRHEGGDKYLADGTLTLKGVTKKVELPFTLTIDGDKAHAQGETTLQRLAFGVGDGPQLSSADVAGLDVKVKIDLHATKK